MPTLAMPEDLTHVLQGDAMSFVKAGRRNVAVT
jgi:hypothetical protein